jgi:hypothetical protein
MKQIQLNSKISSSGSKPVLSAQNFPSEELSGKEISGEKYGKGVTCES